MKRTLSFLWIRRLSLITLFFTGACGLIYEVTWHRYLANLVGSESRASALILAVFLGGLAIGYEIFGRLSTNRSPRALIKMMGWLEIGIGVWAILFPSLYDMTWAQVASGAGFTRLGLFSDALLAIELIFVPTVLMGGTLPLLTQAFSLDLQGSTRVHALIYSMNTLGAFLGCLAAGFILVPQLGLPLTLLTTSFVNLIAGVLLLGVATSASETVAPGAENSSGWRFAKIREMWPAFAIAFGAGFCAITLQTGLVRIVGLTAGSSEYSFSMIVAIYILMLAVGAYQVSREGRGFRDRIWLNQLLIGAGLAFLYVTIPDWPYWAHVLRSIFAPVPPSFYVYHFALFGLLGVMLAIPVHAMGRSMPLLFAAIARDLKRVGADVGAIYFVNTVGCVCGGIVGGYLLYYVFDLDQMMKLLVVVTAAMAALALFTFEQVERRPLALGAVAFVILFAVVWPRWEPNRLVIGTFRAEVTPLTFAGAEEFYRAFRSGDRTLLRRDGPNTSLGITEDITPDHPRAIIVNGKSDGHTREDRLTVALMAHLPALFSEASLKRVAVIGFGTGMTVGSAALYPEVEKVDVFEISETLREHADKFDFANGGMSKSPKVVWHVGDAYKTLLGSSEKYGFIASEPSNPWVVGVERLYSQEFFELAASRIEDGGIFAQWIHTYDLSRETFAIVFKTFSSVFDDVRIFRTKSGDIAILGSKRGLGAANFERARARWQADAVKKDLAAIEIRDLSDLLARELPIPVRYFEDAALQTLEFPKLSYLAGHDFFMRKRVDLDGLINSPLFAPWTQRFAEDSLAARWVRVAGPSALESMTKRWCRREKLEFFPGWKQSGSLCWRGLARAAALGLVAGGSDGFSERERQLLKSVATKEPVSSPKSPVDARMDLDFVARFAFDRLSPKQLAPIAEACGPTDASCRLSAARAIAVFGSPDFAAKMRLEGPPGELEFTSAMLDEARRAYSTQTEPSTN